MFAGPGGIATAPGWTSTDNSNGFGNTLAWRDVDGDGFQELAISDNNQLAAGSGDFKLYDNVAGVLGTNPQWTDFGGFVSALAFADLDGDGLPELAGGLWFGGTWIYAGGAGVPYGSAPQWTSNTAGTVESLFFGDVDGDGLRPAQAQTLAPNGGRTYYADRAPLHELLAVFVDGSPLGPTNYCADLEDGWVALGVTPARGITLVYRASDSLDLGVTHWDQTVGNQVYRHDAIAPPLAGSRTAGSARAP